MAALWCGYGAISNYFNGAISSAAMFSNSLTLSQISNLFTAGSGLPLTPPTVLTPPISQAVLPGGAAMFSAVAGGTGPYNYQWQFDGTNLPSSGVITTVAGNGSSGYSGDGNKATNAGLYARGVAVDCAGNLFIADASNERIRKVDTNGFITTVAGNGSAGFSGDGGAATNARLYYPEGVAVDGVGNLFIADDDNQRIRKVDTNGVITTVAGNGAIGYYGDGGAATNARLYYPYGVAVDGVGNLFIADYDNQRIRKVDTNGIITTVAGNGSAGFAGDGGAATNARLYYPEGVAVDGCGQSVHSGLRQSVHPQGGHERRHHDGGREWK